MEVVNAEPTTCEGAVTWYDTGNSTKRMVYNQISSTRGAGTATYDWSTTNQTQLGIEVTISGNAGNGGLAYSRTQTSGTGGDEHTPNWTHQALEVQWRYDEQQGRCQDFLNGSEYWMDAYKWVPSDFTSGNENDTTVTETWTCNTNYRVPNQNSRRVIEDKTDTFSGWYSIAGISLNLKQEDSSSQKNVYRADVGQTQYLCGNDADPSSANFVREVAGP